MILVHEKIDCEKVHRLLDLLDLIIFAALFTTVIRGFGCPHMEVDDIILLC